MTTGILRTCCRLPNSRNSPLNTVFYVQAKRSLWWKPLSRSRRPRNCATSWPVPPLTAPLTCSVRRSWSTWKSGRCTACMPAAGMLGKFLMNWGSASNAYFHIQWLKSSATLLAYCIHCQLSSQCITCINWAWLSCVEECDCITCCTCMCSQACSNRTGDVYMYPSKEDLLNYTIIVTTLCTAGR